MVDTEIPAGTRRHDQIIIQSRRAGSTDWVDWSGHNTRLSNDPGQRELTMQRRRDRIATMNEQDAGQWEYRLAVRTVWETEWVAV